jgi:hypothetical protein
MHPESAKEHDETIAIAQRGMRRCRARAQFGRMTTQIQSGRALFGNGPPTVYFFLAEHGPAAEAERYQHMAIALGEGLAQLGIPFVSSVDYWPAAPNTVPLFRSDPTVDPAGCSAVVFTTDWFAEGNAIPHRLFAGPSRPVSVYLDNVDGNRLRSFDPGFPKFDLVLRGHYTAAMPYPPGFRPWAFGLSNRILAATEPAVPAAAREQRLIVSYRHTAYPHSVRLYLERHFLSKLAAKLPVYRFKDDFRLDAPDALTEHLWFLTGRRHSKRYYRELCESTACACFGGFFVPAWPRDERHVLSRLMKRAMTRLRLRSGHITQFDSWRLWESFAAGCATVHLDLEKYGAVLPVMPKNWEHYIGLDLDHLDADIDRMLADPGLLARIGDAGKAWAIATYGPAPTARRFLELIGIPLLT